MHKLLRQRHDIHVAFDHDHRVAVADRLIDLRVDRHDLLVLAALEPMVGEERLEALLLPLVFVAGLGVFAFAMRWDMTDPQRETRRSDVAFWLHLLAAPMIAHPLFNWLARDGWRQRPFDPALRA